MLNRRHPITYSAAILTKTAETPSSVKPRTILADFEVMDGMAKGRLAGLIDDDIEAWRAWFVKHRIAHSLLASGTSSEPTANLAATCGPALGRESGGQTCRHRRIR